MAEVKFKSIIPASGWVCLSAWDTDGEIFHDVEPLVGWTLCKDQGGNQVVWPMVYWQEAKGAELVNEVHDASNEVWHVLPERSDYSKEFANLEQQLRKKIGQRSAA